jgi:ABC-2 type transport system permease protein
MLRTVWAIARKDLKVLSRVPTAMFFSLGWPLLMAVLFGFMFGGGGERASLGLGFVDEDGSAASRKLLAGLGAKEGIRGVPLDRAAAASAVRQGKLVAAVVLPKGFGEASERLFMGEPPRVEVLLDPSRKAEGAMIEGLLMEQGAQRFESLFGGGDPGREEIRKLRQQVESAKPGSIPGDEHLRSFLGELDSYLGATAQAPGSAAGATRTTGGFRPLAVSVTKIEGDRRRPASAFSVTFAQGLLWGCIGCAMSFVVGLVQEKTQGTLLRLRVAPRTPVEILTGKALSCTLALGVVQAAVLGVGILVFGVRAQSVPLLAGTFGLVTALFVGLMLLVAGFARTEQAASGMGWAAMMPLSMLGGGMIPLMAMPRWMASASSVSPFKWAILAYEGALWRGFSLREILLPWAILAAGALLSGGLGLWRMRRGFES